MTEPLVTSLGEELLRYLSVSGLFITVALTYTGGLQGTGDTRSPLYISIVSQIVVPIGICTVLQAMRGLQPADIWLAIVLGHLTRAVLSVWVPPGPVARYRGRYRTRASLSRGTLGHARPLSAIRRRRARRARDRCPSRPDRGRGARAARTRRQERAPAEEPVPAWRKFLAQFQDVLVILLLVATAISAALWLYERDSALPYEAIAIFARRAAQRGHGLRPGIAGGIGGGGACARWRPRTRTVIRDGERRSVPAAEVVPGDIILVEEGDTIPADARVIHSTALQTAEAALTGESLPVSKDPRPDRRRGRARRPRQHGLQRHRGDLRPRAGRGRRHRHADRDGAHRRDAAGRRPSETTPLQQELDRVGKMLGLVVVRHRRRDDRDDRVRRARARRLGAVRRADPRRGARRGRGAGRAAGRRDRRPVDRRPAHGAAERDRAAPRGRRDARLGRT